MSFTPYTHTDKSTVNINWTHDPEYVMFNIVNWISKVQFTFDWNELKMLHKRKRCKASKYRRANRMRTLLFVFLSILCDVKNFTFCTIFSLSLSLMLCSFSGCLFALGLTFRWTLSNEMSWANAKSSAISKWKIISPRKQYDSIGKLNWKLPVCIEVWCCCRFLFYFP